jgi:DNA-directed RNA polymerase specialized sigma24 family protein
VRVVSLRPRCAGPERATYTGLLAHVDVTGERNIASQTAFGVADGRILAAIEQLPEGEREAFDLVRIRGMSQAEVGHLPGHRPARRASVGGLGR